MLMKKIPYNLKKFGLIGVLTLIPVFTSCEKDEPIDQKQEKIKELMALEKVQAKAVRDAVEPAKTVEQNITGYFNMRFSDKEIESYSGKAKNLKDSTEIFIYVVEKAHEEYGNPLPTNETTMMDLYNKSKTYIITVTDLENLIKQK